MASDASIPHAGMELHKHAKKVYKKLAPKVLAYAKELATIPMDKRGNGKAQIVGAPTVTIK